MNHLVSASIGNASIEVCEAKSDGCWPLRVTFHGAKPKRWSTDAANTKRRIDWRSFRRVCSQIHACIGSNTLGRDRRTDCRRQIRFGSIRIRFVSDSVRGRFGFFSQLRYKKCQKSHWKASHKMDCKPAKVRYSSFIDPSEPVC